MNLARSKGYKTIANAKTKLSDALVMITGKKLGEAEVHHLISVNDEGRFVPVVVYHRGMMLADYAHTGITVVGG